MESSRDQRLETALRALRPVPRQGFAADLDRRAAAGFAGDGRRAATVSVLARFRLAPRWRPRTTLAGAAVAAVVIATAVVSISDRDRQDRGHAGGGALLGNLNPRQSTHGEVESSEGAAAGSRGTAGASVPVVPSKLRLPAEPSGPFAAGARHRHVERAAEVVLGADPQDVHEVAGQVLAAVHRYDGVVLRSTVNDVGSAPSRFDLLIPSASLSDALADISAAAPVLSRNESTADVTGRVIGLGERLRDSRAKVESLLGELADAESEAAREAIEAELRSARRQESGLRSRLSSLQRRVHFARVSVRIESDAAAGGGGSGSWGVSDGLSAAGRVLATAAGVTLVGLAALALPAALLLAAWLARRAWLRRAREQALG